MYAELQTNKLGQDNQLFLREGDLIQHFTHYTHHTPLTTGDILTSTRASRGGHCCSEAVVGLLSPILSGRG